MLGRHKIVTKRNSELMENIERDIKVQLREKGIIVSGLNMEIKSESISLSIFLSAALQRFPL